MILIKQILLNTTTLFQQYSDQYSTNYASVKIRDMALINFKMNTINISSHSIQLNRLLDQNLSIRLNKRLQLLQHKGISSKQNPVQYCQEHFCAVDSTASILQRIPASVDFRELGLITKAKDQGNCGSCFVFATVAAIENAMLLDKSYYTNLFEGFDAKNLNLSEQFHLSNVRGFASYCDGGDSVAMLSYIHDNKDTHDGFQRYYQTIENTSNYFYDSQSVRQYQAKFFSNQSLAPTYFGLIEPFKSFENKAFVGYNSPAIEIFFNEDKNKHFDSKAIRKIRTYLAQGVSVIAAMCYSTDTSQFATYDGTTILSAQCSSFCSDHQVLITGYGRFNNQTVWIVKNSWGDDWGSDGFFYVEIGSDSYCLEHYAYVIEGTFSEYRDNQDIFKPDPSYVSAFPNILRNGLKYLQIDEVDIIDNYWQDIIPIWLICTLSIVSIAVVITLSTALFFGLRKSRRLYESKKQNHYIQMKEAAKPQIIKLIVEEDI